MALTIDTNLSGKTFYSNDLNEIQISTASEYVKLQLKSAEEEVFSSTYYAVGGMVFVRNLSSFFEALMEQRGATLLGFTLTAADDNSEISSSFFILLCRDRIIDLPAGELLSNYFLTTNLNRLTTIHSCEQLSLYLPTSASSYNITLKTDMVIRLPDGSVVNHTYNTNQSVGSGVVSISILIADLLFNAHAAYPNFNLLYFKLTVGKRICNFYVMPCPTAELFSFRNNFGCMESVSFPATTTSVLDTEYSEVKVDGLLSHYDVRHSRTYEVETSSLVSNQMNWLEQFVTSSQVMKGQGSDAHRVLIKEYTFEQSDAPGVENKLSFTWQFADGRQTQHQLSFHSHIFSDPFNETYA